MIRRLKTLADVRKYVASLINRVELGLPAGQALDPVIAGKLAYLANSLRAIIEKGDLETRFDALEAKIEALIKEKTG